MFSDLTATQLVIVFVSIVLSMAIHEALHAFTSHWLGDTTAKDMGRLTLNPLIHIDVLTTVLLPMVLILVGAQPFFIAKPVPFNPERVKYEEFGAALIGIAGPLTNLALAVLVSIVVRVGNVAIGTGLGEVLGIFVAVNIGMFVFNMIPFPPLDGSRLLYAFAPEPVQKVMYQIEAGGITSILIFIFLIFPLFDDTIYNIMTSIYLFLLG